MRNLGSILLLLLATVGALLFLPEAPWRHLQEPTYSAVPGTVVSVLVVLYLRTLDERGARIEPWIFAVFLALMPTVYLSSWLRSPERESLWLLVELGGLLIYGGLAVLGMRRSYWFLAAGIAAHGLFWDLWHHGRSTYIASWYVDACLIIDLGFGAYVALQVPRWTVARAHKNAITATLDT